MDEDERRRKVEAGRAKKSFNMPRNQSLASYRQKRAKGDTSGQAKKTQKRKGPTVSQIQSAAAQDAELKNKTNHEKPPKKSEVRQQQNQQQGDQDVVSGRSLSPAVDFKGEELVALTGKEQLKQLHEAVEKRNEIIARLSSNLQEALASRDQVQLEAQSLAGQIQALQRQLQQTSVEFLRFKSHPGAEVCTSLPQHQHGIISDADICEKEAPAGRPRKFGPEPQSSFQSNDNETDKTLQQLQAQLEEERENSLRLSTDLAQEIEKHQRALFLLEEERKSREEERHEMVAQLRDLQTQLDCAQTQCLEMQQFKAEKENLNREVQELTQKLQVKDDAERRLCAEVLASSEEIRRLEEELEQGAKGVWQLMETGEVQVVRIKDSKNRENQAKAGVGCDEGFNADNSNVESESDQHSINVPISGDVLMERYLSSALPERPQSANDSFEHSSQVDGSVDNSFELNSEVLGEEPLLSISNRFVEEGISLCDDRSPRSSLGVSGAGSTNLQCVTQWHHSSSERDTSELSEHQTEETGLEKELLSQQCRELREELDVKDRDLNVLREEVVRNVEELEEARSRWAQVTDELKEALLELQVEKEKRRCVEEQMNTRVQEQDNLKNKLSALMEERETFTREVLLGKEIESSQRKDEKHLHNQQNQCDFLTLELEESKTREKSTAALLRERTKELAEASKEVETIRAELLCVQTEVERLRDGAQKRQESLDEAERDKRELASQIFCLRQNLANLEEAQSHAAREREEHRRKEEEMNERIRKMEQVLEEEVEQFESLLKAKDEEVTQEREKWEEERQEKDKELFGARRHLEEQRSKWKEEVKALLEKQAMSVEEVTNRLQTSHKEEVGKLQEKHHREISDLNAKLESELLMLQAKMEEEQKKQISLIKQVTEREHERIVAELSAKHDDEVVHLRESMEAAHQAELEQAQTQKSSELEALHLSLTDAHVSQTEHSKVILEQEQQSALAKLHHSLQDKFNQERALMQARHESEMDQVAKRNQENQQKVQELHKQMTNDLKEQWEKTVAQEKAVMEDKHANDIQALQLKWDKDAAGAHSLLQASLSETQNELGSMRTLLSQKDRALTETQATLSQVQSELQESVSRLAHLQVLGEEQSRKLGEELKQALADRDAAARSLEELVSSNEAVLKEKEQQTRHLADKELQMQKEVSRLQEEKKLLKQNSDDEISQLWSQLDSMRASRQELGELKEQLLARSSRVDDIERLKAEFSHQKQEMKEQNEAEMESLRRYFEQRLRVAEETYREEITILQLRLVESALEESVKTTESSFLSQGQVEEDEAHSLTDPDLTQREPKGRPDSDSELQSSMGLSFKEELQQVRSDLTDRYYNELQELKTHHALEQEQLRAKLSDRHLQEINKVLMEASHQVEVEVEQRMWYHMEELQAITTIVHSLENRLIAINQEHEAEKQKYTQQLKWEFGEELKKFQEQVQHQLNQAEETIEEEKSMLEQALAQKYEITLTNEREKHQAELKSERAALLSKHSQERDTLNIQHKAQVETLGASHRAELAAAAAELLSKHSAELVALEVALGSKRQADLDSLEAAFRETNQAQLEAREAELVRRHQEELDELEKRLLDNMETVEATYLKEVQALREEIGQLEEKHQQNLNCQKSEHGQEMEGYAAEQLTLREELRKELAQVHIAKFSAMAAELSQLHKSELTAQKEALDTDHCRALESLKKQVLELEQQHGAALLQLTQSCNSEKEEVIKQHQLQLQELRGVSARELEACRRELEEESSRQRQHFLEEVELLKVQSEERLQDRISQLKTEFEEEKQADLDNLRRSFTSEQDEKERSYTGKMSQLTAQLQTLDAVVAQLRTEVGCLQTDLSGKQAEMETLNTLLQRREREGQEGGNLVKMLTDDLRTAKEESNKLDQANTKLRKVLIEMIRSTVATEELIGQKICSRAKSSEILSVNKDSQTAGILVADSSSDDPELTHMLCESLLISEAQITPEGEEASHNACSRLHQAVDTLLELLNQANKQLEQTHDVHLSLEEKFSRGKEDSAHLLEQHKLVMEQLDQEAKLKTELQLKLHKAEGLVDGYMTDKAALEEALQQKEVQEERLAEELEDLKGKLLQAQGLAAELESLRAKHQELSEEHTVVLRQKEYLSVGLGEREKALLAETERLAQDRIDLQRQAERDTGLLSQRLKALERELEEQETKGLETEEHHKSRTEDLSQQVQALEKQLKNNRQFIEEQAIEREHERDDFQQEIHRLEAQLRQTAGGDVKGHKVESLQAIIKDKTDDHAALLTANQQAQRDLEERNEEIDKLAGRIRELEQALLNSAESNRATLQLEQELHRVKLREQELTQDKQALEQQQLSNKLQISALQSKLDETRHCYHDNTRDPTQELRDVLDAAQQSLHTKEQEVEGLQVQLERVQSELNIKEVEIKHLTVQLELLTNQNSDRVAELQQHVDVLTENVAALSVQKKETEPGEDAPVEEMLASALLQEKNLEIDHLSNEIQKLEQELESTKNNKVLEAELEDLRSQVEHLQSEVTRVREDRQEEEERLHEVISTLQAELNTLGPNLHEVSDSQDGDSINPSPAVSPEPNLCTVQEQQRPGEPNSLKEELNLTHSASIRSHQSRIKALQSQLETAVAEKEALERLLFTQEEEYRGHGEELGNKLRAEREKAEELHSHLALKEAELKDIKEQMKEEQERRKLSEEERDGCKVEVEEARALREKNEHLSSLVVELQSREEGSLSEICSLQTKHQEMKTETEAFRETSLTLERQVREVRAELVDMEEMVAEERTKIQTLEAVKEDLSAECNVLRGREKQLQEEIERLRQEVTSLGARVQNLTVQLSEKEVHQEAAQKEVLTHAEVTLAKADDALRAKEGELGTLKAKYQTLKAELVAVKQSLSSSRERCDKLEEEAQTKDQALVDLESDNRRLNTELQSLQDDLAAQGEELSCQRGELQQLKQLCHQQETLTHRQKDTFHRAFEEALSVSQSEDCLSSPEVLRRIECSEDRRAERFHVSAVSSHLSELSALNTTGVELAHYTKTSPRVLMETQHSGTITPEPPSRTSHSPGTISMSDNFSVLDSLDTDRVHESEGLDHTRPPSPLGSTSSLSAPEWASDGYGSNVSSELGARLRVELEQTERLDAQFVEYLRCRGINPTVNTDSAAGSMSYSEDLLSPELQGLLKKVYQESCRILTLSQRRPTTLSQPTVPEVKLASQTQYHTGDGATLLNHGDKPTSSPPMTWQQEKRALQETVIALREMLCRMAQRQPQTDSRVEDDWSRQQFESQLRAELEESQKQLKCAHSIQQEQKSKIQSLRLAVDGSEESLRKEQSRVQELEQLLEQERAVSVRKNKELEEKRGALQASTGQQKAEVMTLRGQVEQERVACSNLRQELQIEQSRSVLLEKRLEDTHKELEKERQCSTLKLELSLQEKTSLERLLGEAESRSAEKLRSAHRQLDEERDRRARQVEELNRRHEMDAASDRQFICDLRAQLEQERRQGQDLASTVDKLRTELLQSKRNWEEEDRGRREELLKLQEAVARHRAAVEALKEQKQEASRALEVEREQARHQATQLAELKERVRLLKDREREREEQWQRERGKVRQEQVDREKRHDRTNNKLCELELLRRQDQQQLHELQQTLAELQREEKEMAAQRLNRQTAGQQNEAPSSNHRQAGGTPKHQQPSSPNAVEMLLKENSELMERVTSLSQEKASLKHTLAGLERQLRRTEADHAMGSNDSENRPIVDLISNSKVQRLYERYLRAESFRKALVYQKRYLLLLLGGFQECEQATLCLIATMGVRTSPTLSSQRTPLGRFRAAVRVAIAVSRMRFLTRKWQKAIRRLSVTSTVNGYPPGNKVEVLRQQQPRIIADTSSNRDAIAALVPPTKSPFRLHNRSYSSTNLATAEPSHNLDSLTDYIHHLEKVQQRLVGPWQGSSCLQRDPKMFDH